MQFQYSDQKQNNPSALKAALAEPQVAMFMPALNEEKYIGENLSVVNFALRHGLLDSFVLVLDGCTDRTQAIVEESFSLSDINREKLDSFRSVLLHYDNGAQVLIESNRKPQGKGLAFARSVWKLDELGFFDKVNATLVTVDADALNLRPTTAYRLAHEMLQNEHQMMLGVQQEQAGFFKPNGHEAFILTPERFNGFRAISASALRPLIERDEQWMRVFPAGICMEVALNDLICAKERIPSNRVGDNRVGVPCSRKVVLQTAVTGKNVEGHYQAELALHIDWRFNRTMHPGFRGPDGFYQTIHDLATVSAPQASLSETEESNSFHNAV